MFVSFGSFTPFRAFRQLCLFETPYAPMTGAFPSTINKYNIKSRQHYYGKRGLNKGRPGPNAR